MHPLRDLSLDELRRRTSMKWREYGHDVLPFWVAEMDVRLAAPIIDAITQAITEATPAIRTGAATPRRTPTSRPTVGVGGRRLVPHGPGRRRHDRDRRGVAPGVRAPGDAVVVNPPVYPPFSAS